MRQMFIVIWCFRKKNQPYQCIRILPSCNTVNCTFISSKVSLSSDTETHTHTNAPCLHFASPLTSFNLLSNIALQRSIFCFPLSFSGSALSFWNPLVNWVHCFSFFYKKNRKVLPSAAVDERYRNHHCSTTFLFALVCSYFLLCSC